MITLDEKTSNPCTYKQYEYIRSFDNFSDNSGRSTTAIMSYLSQDAASEIIDALKRGSTVSLKKDGFGFVVEIY